MSPTELDIFRDLLSSLEKKINIAIDKLTQKIDTFQENVSDVNIKIGVMQERQDTSKDNLKKNFEQHDEFYHRLNNLEQKPELESKVEIVSKKAELNENDIIKIKQTAWTAYVIIGVIFTAITILIKLKIL